MSHEERMEQANQTLRALGGITQLDSLPQAARLKAFQTIMSIGFDRALSDLEYLEEHTPTGDPKREGISELVRIVRQILANKKG